ncbi:MarR family winged helix-turn-helix transcriptional regulator [Pseudonocardia sp. TRM90224]|uniref:MarR family winged helix-turn-helix transcriptional regulator n=1 Tax=Pseudonocardia sp. TRM90224 TaxID=2812678 RepID=UPI001E5FEDBE|nr:MarR family winged helix-turn-helix transcriptional regulator [Pseudonocardia sp. TRM90224]
MDMRPDEEIRGDLSFLFDKGSQRLAARVAAALAEVGLTAREYCVLSKAVPGHLTQGEIAEIALLDKTTMVVTMDKLENAGLARRTPSPHDRRARIVEATSEGAELAVKAQAITKQVFDEVLSVLPDALRETFLDAMVRLVGVGGPLSDTAAAPTKSSRTV